MVVGIVSCSDSVRSSRGLHTLCDFLWTTLALGEEREEPDGLAGFISTRDIHGSVSAAKQAERGIGEGDDSLVWSLFEVTILGLGPAFMLVGSSTSAARLIVTA